MSARTELDPVAADEGLTRGGVGVPGRAALIWVEGGDAVRFLQGLWSNDVETLAPADSCRALLLDARGHIAADARVHRDGPEAFTLVLEPALADVAFARMEEHYFSERLELLGPEPTELLTVAGRAPESDLVEMAVRGLVPGTHDLICADATALLDALDWREAPVEALEARRIAAGVARVGVDTGPTSLVQEAGLAESAVSFSKGCYLGQETVARTQYRGRVNRVLRGLALGAIAAPGAPVAHAEREIGVLTSVARSPRHGPIGLAMLRREVAPGARVDVAGADGPARVVELPFG